MVLDSAALAPFDADHDVAQLLRNAEAADREQADLLAGRPPSARVPLAALAETLALDGDLETDVDG